jgi:predicted enzyme related to lactoylglutathione lyase
MILSMIKSVKFVSIPVKDQDKALEFYTKALGFNIATDQPMGPGQQRWIELRIPGADTRVVLFTADGHEDRIGTFTGVSFNTDNVEKTHADYVARGVEFSEGPTKQPWGTYAIFKDVDGNQFVLSQK